jgi:hypothetical protein
MALIGIGATLGALKKELKKVEGEGISEVKSAVATVLAKMMARTPVWTGETVRNFTAGLGSKDSSFSAGSQEPPEGSTPSKMGNEVNRAANVRAAMGAAKSTTDGLKDLKKNVHITNTIASSKWDLIDSGSAPTKERARNPGGVSSIAIQGARAVLKNWK